MIFTKPLPLVLTKAAMRKVIMATSICFQSPSVTKPALVTAELAKPSPMMIIIGPMTMGGKRVSIHLVPTILTRPAMRT